MLIDDLEILGNTERKSHGLLKFHLLEVKLDVELCLF